MVAWTHLRKFSAIAIGTGAGLASYYYQRLREQKTTASASWTESSHIEISPGGLWDSNWDCRDPKCLVKPIQNDTEKEENRYNCELEKVVPKAMRHIILIRHGEYLDLGNNDENHKLTERGCRQAKFTGQRLHELGIKWEKVIMSTMTRAQQTGNIILKEIDFDANHVNHCSLIREGAPIPPQPPVGHWRPEKSQFFRDGARIEAGFRAYFHRALPNQEKDTYTLIVGHGNVIRYFVCRALQLPPEAWLRLSINHGSITWLSINPSGSVSIKYLGDTGFMPIDHLTYKIPRPGKHI